jgi:hypothetical protein
MANGERIEGILGGSFVIEEIMASKNRNRLRRRAFICRVFAVSGV